jgi:hypothetical protein
MMLFWVAGNFLQMQAISHSKIALKAYNGKYVCADGNRNDNLVADRTKIDAWETFEVISLSGSRIALRAYNGKYVCADGNKNYNVIANRVKIDAWETFDLIILGGGNIALKASNGKYLCADGNKKNNLVADRNLIKEWETFEIIPIPNNTRNNKQPLKVHQMIIPKDAPADPSDTVTVTVHPVDINFTPPHVKGDREFKGHGPYVKCTVTLKIEGLKLYAQVYMNAVETVADYTEAEGFKDFVIYDDWPVLDFANSRIQPQSKCEYTDDNEEDDIFVQSPGDIVEKFIFRGDIHGNDAGIATRVVVYFNDIELIVKK